MPSSRTRRSADERRDELVVATIAEFAQSGLQGASTEAIARRAGVSHAYLFRLFGTKRELFLAAVDRSWDNALGAFKQAWSAEPDPDQAFRILGQGFIELVAERGELLFQLHAYAACGDPDIRDRVRERWQEVYDWVKRTTGRTDAQVKLFMSAGLLITVGGAMDREDLASSGAWTAELMDPGA